MGVNVGQRSPLQHLEKVGAYGRIELVSITALAGVRVKPVLHHSTCMSATVEAGASQCEFNDLLDGLRMLPMLCLKMLSTRRVGESNDSSP